MSTEQKQENEYPEYPVFMGLQRPLECMGIQGRYIFWTGGVAGCAIIGFIAAYCLIGFIAGLIMLVVSVGGGTSLIILKQKRGLHSKKIDKGVFVYAYSKKI